ncbi:capsular polysaccharide export protein, LipB/KpsS family [Halomonas sp. PA16-9]|uniref:capsular polysaccharide export protein, LipB/KpsS family n=1 Tax=Halomonas sp. PA16-9 TaxID=2576841 RepID=UPI0030EC7444
MKHQKRAFLFLQGVCSPFYQRLAKRLVNDGHRVVKVNFNAGDIAYWQRTHGQSHLFRGPTAELPGYIKSLWQRYAITDQVVFGDRRPIHRPAVDNAAAAGVRTHVFEEGYFRPFWITLEREGVNGHSLLPRTQAGFMKPAKHCPNYPPPCVFAPRLKFVPCTMWATTWPASQSAGCAALPQSRADHRPGRVRGLPEALCSVKSRLEKTRRRTHQSVDRKWPPLFYAAAAAK